jgi:hypothetical protein
MGFSNSTSGGSGGGGGGGLVAQGIPQGGPPNPTVTINLGGAGAASGVGEASGAAGSTLKTAASAPGAAGAPANSQQSFSLGATAASAQTSGPAQVTTNPAPKVQVDGSMALLAVAFGLVLV